MSKEPSPNLAEAVHLSPRVPVSILIPIKNEASNLPRCLAAVTWADEVFVVDSQSADGSQKIATDAGAKVVQFAFNGTWPKKKNWALENLPFRNEWVFILDADEVLPPETAAEFQAIVSDPAHAVAGYWINRRFMFMGKWLRHAYYPNWNLRLFKHRLGRYEKLTDVDTQSGDNEVHEHVVVQGETGYLRSEMDHYAFPSVGVFVEKHNRYSNWEARVALDRYLQSSDTQLQKAEVGMRRRLKQLSASLPCRGLLRFLYVYLWQRGCLDGMEGYYFSMLHGFYEFLSESKTYELRKEEERKKMETSGASVAPQPDSWFSKVERVLAPLSFGAALCAILYFALVPNVHHTLLDGLPYELRLWIGLHDNLSNILAFFVLGGLTFRALLYLPTAPGADVARKQGQRQFFGLVVLLGLVCLLEFVQLWIPGRDSSLEDVLTGSSGVLLAWIGQRILPRPAK